MWCRSRWVYVLCSLCLTFERQKGLEPCRFKRRQLMDAYWCWCWCFAADADASCHAQTPETTGGTDFLPYSSIDRLFALCEASLARQSAAPAVGVGKAAAVNGLNYAFETAQERLTEYFKVRPWPLCVSIEGSNGSTRFHRRVHV